ncbi:DUF6351 family protein [Bermanella sp. WJH001]|uniref:DUF6351 family protein n=1 Tax=Bermanella sp. WJH001 TaxID=3048005 RepID=UPI0024BE6F3B|nr:DUF6351 family protein [Bermanella sp. WJH001]MDJ1538093.1 DUF6351 family protein [Bermanella sp. WJH001]
MKTALIVLAVILICTTSLGVFYDRLEQRFLPKTSGLLVLNTPDNFTVEKNLKSYTGLHPRLIDRPNETFPFPIPLDASGPVEPLFAGANQYPFICDTEHSNLGQPLVDNQEKHGIAVYRVNEKQKKTKEIIGYSKDCRLPTRIQYYVKDVHDHGFIKVDDLLALKQETQQIIRIETGTINRFIYVLAVPVNKQDLPEAFNSSKWNQKLLYRFKGGVGVGRKQGNVNIDKLLYEHEKQLQQGYAVAFSTGTQTSNHYDIWLSEDTALRVKRQFESRYGKPLYTIGVGGSGGAIQQYLLAQNHPGIIDGAIPLYSYPDMVTQVTYALDCELLEYYFDEVSQNEQWQNWPLRTAVQGSLALQGYKNKYGNLQGIAAMLNGDFSKMPTGASECTNGWRGPSHLINNPKFFADYHEVSEPTFKQFDWSHWGDLHRVYGTDANGYGRRFWGNDGVQYGLLSLRNGELSIDEFVQLNQKVGGWKALPDMENDRFWHISGDTSLSRLTLWSQHNMTHDGRIAKAKRTQGDAAAAKAAYDAGLVFLGVADIPIIDLRHYLDHKLDMHHSVASFTARKRIEYASGSSEHQLIWMMEKDDSLSRKELIRSLPIDDALRVLDQWLFNIKANPDLSLVQNRPAGASDRCYDKDNNIIDDSAGTWDGLWNQKVPGPCQQRFPHYTQSRYMAGESLYSDTLYCEKQPVARAIASGMYGDRFMKPYQVQLEQVFPNGVCKYPQGVNPRVSELVKELRQKKVKLSAAGA